MTKIFSMQLSDAQYEALEKIAQCEDRSKGYLVRSVLLNFIQDYQDAIFAEKVSKEIEQGKRKTIPWEEVKKRLKLDK